MSKKLLFLSPFKSDKNTPILKVLQNWIFLNIKGLILANVKNL
jgi:hypothetical protein